jgi:hypothetical protein
MVHPCRVLIHHHVNIQVPKFAERKHLYHLHPLTEKGELKPNVLGAIRKCVSDLSQLDFQGCYESVHKPYH